MAKPLIRLAAMLICLMLPVILALAGSLHHASAKKQDTYSMTASAYTPEGRARNMTPSAEAVEGFYQAAFDAEFGDTGRDELIRWQIPLSIFIKGEPVAEDLRVLERLMENLAEIVPGMPGMSFAESEKEANVVIAFVPFESMPEYLVNYEDDNWGYMNCFSDDTTIRYGMIAIASDVTAQEDRTHLIQEEFINMLGLTEDIDNIPQSIIYQPYTVTADLCEEDYEMLSLLYGPYLPYGISRGEARTALEEMFSQD